MRLMISVVSSAEAQLALQGGAEILDIKNPAEGALGAQPPGVIREIADLVSQKASISAAIGDMPNLPGTAALAALGAAACGVEFVKVGLYGPRSVTEAIVLLQEMRRAVKDFGASIIAAAYADFQRAGTLDPAYLPRIAALAGIQGCLIDTFIKDGSGLFDFLSLPQIGKLVKEAHAAGLLFGLAGALQEEDLPLIRDLGADIVGFRTAACRNNRRGDPLEITRVEKLRRMLVTENSEKINFK